LKDLTIALKAVNIDHDKQYLPESDWIRLNPKGDND